MLTEHLSQCIYKWRNWASEWTSFQGHVTDVMHQCAVRTCLQAFTWPHTSHYTTDTVSYGWAILIIQPLFPSLGYQANTQSFPLRQISLNRDFILAPGEKSTYFSCPGLSWDNFSNHKKLFFFFYKKENFPVSPPLYMVVFYETFCEDEFLPRNSEEQRLNLSQKYSWRWQKWFSTSGCKTKAGSKEDLFLTPTSLRDF